MLLNVKERFALRSVFKPQMTSLFEADLYDEFLDKIKITAEEEKKLNMRIENNMTTWDADKDKGIGVEITESLLNILKRAVKSADEQKRIPYDPDDKTVIVLAKKIKDYKIKDYKIKEDGADDNKKD